MTDTPRTDALELKVGHRAAPGYPLMVVLARQLERELASSRVVQMQERIDQLRHTLNWTQSYIGKNYPGDVLRHIKTVLDDDARRALKHDEPAPERIQPIADPRGIVSGNTLTLDVEPVVQHPNRFSRLALELRRDAAYSDRVGSHVVTAVFTPSAALDLAELLDPIIDAGEPPKMDVLEAARNVITEYGKGAFLPNRMGAAIVALDAAITPASPSEERIP